MAKYQLITYDIWGNAREGFYVNQVFNSGVTIGFGDSKIVTDRMINRALGVRGIVWDGDDNTLYGTVKRNGKPALELRLVAE